MIINHSKKINWLCNTTNYWSINFFILSLSLYIACILGLSLSHGLSTPLSPLLKSGMPLTPLSTANDYLTFFTSSDPASYARGGLALAGREWGGDYDLTGMSLAERLKTMNLIGFGIWPPGMYILNAIPLIIDNNMPLGLWQIIISSILWGLAFALIASVLQLKIPAIVAMIFPMSLFCFPLFHNYFFHYGVAYSETYAAALMTIAVSLLIIFYYRKPQLSLMLLAGCCLALSCFFRSQMSPVTIGFSIIIILFNLLSLWPLNKSGRSISLLSKGILLFLIATYIPLGGYLLFNNYALFNADYVWELPFTLPAFEKAGAGSFLVAGGIKAACEADKPNCHAIAQQIKSGVNPLNAKKKVFESFLQHPINFSFYKLPVAWRYWMFSNNNPAIPIEYKLDSIAIIMILMACVAIMLWQRLWLLLALTLGCAIAIIGPPFLLHFEARFFYLLKSYILFLPFWLLIIMNK